MDDAEALPEGDVAPAGDVDAATAVGPSGDGPGEGGSEEQLRWRLAAVSGVLLELPGVHPEVVLSETDAPWRELRIPVGFAEGSAIAYAWRKIETPRPLTHELVATLLEHHGVEVLALRITARQGSMFAAELETNGPGGTKVVSCRPSDGLALALRRRLPTPILVAEEVFLATPSA